MNNKETKDLNQAIEATDSNEQQEAPIWLHRDTIDEVLFCEEFLSEHPMVHMNRKFFGADGWISDEGSIRSEIYQKLKPYIHTGLAKKMPALFDVLKSEAYCAALPAHEDRIHVANGTLFVDRGLSEEKEVCVSRLPVAYLPDAPEPKRWLQFLGELLYPEDIPTVQEYFGYCLLPTTRAQKMLMIIGKGGEGKSRIGVVLSALFGDSLYAGSIAKVATNRFARADLEHKLLLVDDDMKLEALPETNTIKAIVTSEIPMDLERKGIQSYQGAMYARLIGFGNGSLKSLYDRSYGFYRRQLILKTKDRPDDREDDPYLSEKLLKELDGIFLWALEGLRRLMANGYNFTVSERAKRNLDESIYESNTVNGFLESEGYIKIEPGFSCSTKELYEVYLNWCEDNAYPSMSKGSFVQQMGMQAAQYGMAASNNLYENGKRLRGYEGVFRLA